MSEGAVDPLFEVDPLEAAALGVELAAVRKPAGPRLERVVLLTLAAVQFTSIVDFMVVMPLGPQLMRKLHIDPAQFGWVVSSYTFAAGVAGIVASSLVDRFGRKAAFLTLYGGFLVGTLLCGLSPNYATLVLARIATGAFGGILGGMALAIIGDVFPPERRGRATGALMSAFALASVVGVPFGLYLGTNYGWHVPFLLLAGLGCPVMLVAARVLPPLREHLKRRTPTHPLRSLAETFSHPNHLNAFALVVTLMFGGFAVIPFISPYLVANVGMTEAQLPFVYLTGGGLTLVTAPWIGRMADRYGKLRVYRIVAPISAVLMIVVTNLPRVGPAAAVAATGFLMVSNAGRMVAALAMVTDSVVPARRGGFMSANSSVQHLATGLGAAFGGLVIAKGADGRLLHFDRVGMIAVTATLLSLWLAGRLRSAEATPGPEKKMTPSRSLGAAAEASCDAGEPIAETGSF
jgi:predicted MFS family arabinose efflux permease